MPLLLGSEAGRELGRQRGRADPTNGFDDADQLSGRMMCRGRYLRDMGLDGIERGLELGDVERQWKDVVRPGTDQRTDERQRWVIGGGDQRGAGRRDQPLEPLYRGWCVGIDLDDRCRRA